VPLARHARDDLRGIPGYVRALFLVLFLCLLALFSVSKESYPTATRWATVLLLLEMYPAVPAIESWQAKTSDANLRADFQRHPRTRQMLQHVKHDNNIGLDLCLTRLETATDEIDVRVLIAPALVAPAHGLIIGVRRCDPSTEIGRRLRQAWTRREPTAAHEIGSFEL
jgi:hypothetical protein